MRSTALLLVLLVGVGSAAAQPKIRMQPVHDWGRIDPKMSGDRPFELKASIPVTNVGTDTLRLLQVIPDCGCTTAPVKDSTLAPGESTSIEVGLMAPPSNGTIRKSITVVTNEPVDNSHNLQITADIQRPVQLSGSFVGFNKGIVGTETLGEFTITNKSPDTLVVSEGTVEYGGRFITPLPAKVAPEEALTISLGLIWNEPGPFSTKITFKTSHPDHQRVEIMGYGIAEVPEQKP